MTKTKRSPKKQKKKKSGNLKRGLKTYGTFVLTGNALNVAFPFPVGLIGGIAAAHQAWKHDGPINAYKYYTTPEKPAKKKKKKRA